MRALWFTNHILLPEHALSLDRKPLPICGWIPSLADALVERSDIQLGIASNVKGNQWAQKNINKKIYFAIPASYRKLNYRHLPKKLIRFYQQTVEEFKPDIIHIHGTEYFHGLLTGRKHIQQPAVISIQGIIDICKNVYWGDIPFMELIKSRTFRDWIRLDGLIEQKIKWYRRAKWEREIFRTNMAFIGRTQWDFDHTRRLNPTARYYHCDEILRAPFYRANWNIDNINRHTIFTTSALYPLKGFHTLIKAVMLLLREFPDISVRIPSDSFYHTDIGVKRFWKNLRSGGYAKYLTDLIKESGIGEHICSLGSIDAEAVSAELTRAHVFVLPSFIENSPNSLAEAMMVGTPSVISLVGGVPSLIQEGRSALCFPPGDEAILAGQIRRIFLNDELANTLSKFAKGAALIRHAKDEIVGSTLRIYKNEIDAYALKVDNEAENYS